MHEMALMEGVIKVVTAKAAEHEISQISKVRLVVGQLTNALPQALQLAFTALTQWESIFKSGAQLEIAEIATRGKCGHCRLEFAVPDNYSFICPACKGTQIDIISGRELYVDYFEGE